MIELKSESVTIPYCGVSTGVSLIGSKKHGAVNQLLLGSGSTRWLIWRLGSMPHGELEMYDAELKRLH